jgi:hypothetical protein
MRLWRVRIWRKRFLWWTISCLQLSSLVLLGRLCGSCSRNMLRRLVGVVFCTTIRVVSIRLPSKLPHENYFSAENLRACDCFDTATISNRSLQPTSPVHRHVVGAFGLKGVIDDESLVIACVKEQRETFGLRVCRRFATKKIGFCAWSSGGDGAAFEPWF